MPRFFFEFRTGGEVFTDKEGLEFEDRNRVRDDARRAMADIAGDRPAASDDCSRIVAIVRDEAGRLVFTAAQSLVDRSIH